MQAIDLEMVLPATFSRYTIFHAEVVEIDLRQREIRALARAEFQTRTSGETLPRFRCRPRSLLSFHNIFMGRASRMPSGLPRQLFASEELIENAVVKKMPASTLF